jgi:hypothetical protein
LVNHSFAVVVEFDGVIRADLQASAAAVAGTAVDMHLHRGGFFTGKQKAYHKQDKQQHNDFPFFHLALLTAL